MEKSTSQILLMVGALVILPFPLAAKSPADVPAFSLSAKELLEMANQQTGTATAPAVVLLDDEHWKFADGRSIERKEHQIFKIVDQSAVQGWSSLQERWEPWREERPSFRARVVTADGAAHELDPKTLTDAPAGSNLPQSYSDVRVLQGPLPAIAVGAVVEYELTEHITTVLGSFTSRRYVASVIPVRFSRFSADYPESLPFRYGVDLCPDLQSAKEIRDGMVHLVLSFGGFDAITEVDPLLPFDVARIPGITFSTGSSWNEIAVEYGKVVDRQIADAPVQTVVNDALKGEKNRSAIIQKLVSSLHAEVRYTGVEFADAAILPAKPAETLARKYGDCKDKAALLVAMLRTAGIPAYVALLNAGLEQDVAAEYPGMGMFNHAIVYVPGTPNIWIDATAEYAQAGELPPPDQGRQALIVRPGSQTLTKIPESASAANVTATELDYFLPEFGPSHVVTSLSGTGPFDSGYREMGALLDNDDIRKRVQKQSQAEWNAKGEIKVSHPPARDLSQPFQIKSDVPDARMVMVSETGTTLTLPVNQVFSALPQFFVVDDAKDNDSVKKKARASGFVLPTAFVGRVSCRIHIPTGLALKKMPEDQTVKLGPAVYTARYVLKDRWLTADIAFDATKRNYTLEEGKALKSAAVEFFRQPLPVVNFEPQGQSLVEEGKLREGLTVFRELAANSDAKAVNHARLARAYLNVGCGEEARKEAKLANQLLPELPLTWRTLAFVYEHDLIGRRYKQGWDPATVESALRKAISLDADDVSANVELAEAFAYDANGAQYQPADRLAKAVEIFEALGDDKVEQQGAQDTMLWDLAVLGKLDECKLKLDRFGSNGSRAGYRVFLTAAQAGAGKAAADLRASASGEDLKQAFLSAAGLMATTGRYELEADLASAVGIEVFMPAAALRNVRRVDPKMLRPDSAENLVRCFLAAQFDAGETEESLERFWSPLATYRLRAYLRQNRQTLLGQIAQHGIMPAVGRDVTLANTKIVSDTNGAAGYRVRIAVGGRGAPLYVEADKGAFKLLGGADVPEGVAQQALADLRGGKLEIARKWLDWLREEIKIHSEDDPLGGDVFPRVWNKGAPASADQVRYAAATLISSKDVLPILQEAIDGTADSSVKVYYQLAYARACIAARSWDHCVPVAKLLVSAYPQSDTALAIAGDAFAGAGQVEAAKEILKKAISENPDNLALKRAFSSSLTFGGDFKGAFQVAKETAETPNAAATDWNRYGWLSLFAGGTDEAMVHAVERATGQAGVAIENTVAAMYAEVGQVNEARRLSLQILDKFGYRTPDPAWWYVFARISEQLGAKESAGLYYRKAELDADGEGLVSVRVLARKRLGVMGLERAAAN